LILGALVSLGVGLVFVAVLLALVIVVSSQVMGRTPRRPPTPAAAPAAPAAPTVAPAAPAASTAVPAAPTAMPAAPAMPSAAPASDPSPSPSPSPARGAESMPAPALAQADSAAAVRQPEDSDPSLRACRECLSVIADPASESCPVCGGELAPQRQLGAPGLVRNPMHVVDDERLRAWIGMRLDDMYGARIGTVDSVVLDPETSVIWLLVRVQRFGDWHTLVPAQGAMLSNGRLLVRYPRTFVRDGPRGLTTDAYLWGPYRSRLYRYYRPPGKPRNRQPEKGAAGAQSGAESITVAESITAAGAQAPAGSATPSASA
jgi:Na+-transporting methylmalonyl-CoA/oxaloacetate decarboxylase gamma subunit